MDTWHYSKNNNAQLLFKYNLLYEAEPEKSVGIVDFSH